MVSWSSPASCPHLTSHPCSPSTVSQNSPAPGSSSRLPSRFPDPLPWCQPPPPPPRSILSQVSPIRCRWINFLTTWTSLVPPGPAAAAVGARPPGRLKAETDTQVGGGARAAAAVGAPWPAPLLCPPRPSRLQPCPLTPSPLASSSWASTGLRVTDDTLPGAWLRSPPECS